MIRGEPSKSVLLEGGVSSAKEKFQSKCEAWSNPRSRQGSLVDGRHWEAPVQGQLKDTMEKFNRNAEKWERRGTGEAHEVAAPYRGQLKDTMEKFNRNAEKWERRGTVDGGINETAPARGQLKDKMEKFSQNAEKWERRGTVEEKRGSVSGMTDIHACLDDACRTIAEHGQRSEDGTMKITFGELYEKCPTLAKKLGSILVLARKQNYVDFEGDMLYRHGSEDVVITLLKGAAEATRTHHG